jgi:hypothetical protein
MYGYMWMIPLWQQHKKEIEQLKQCLKQKFDITSHDFTKHLGINVERLESGAVKLRQRKLLRALFEEYPPSSRKANQPQRVNRNDEHGVNDQGKEPCEQREYLHLLGMLNYIAHSGQISLQLYLMLQQRTAIHLSRISKTYC